MLVYLGFLFITALIICISGVIVTKGNDNWFGAMMLMVLFTIISNAPTVINYTMVANRQAIVNKQSPMIEHYQNYIDRLDVKIAAAGDKGQAMFTSNHDTPVKSMVEAQLKAEDSMLWAAKARDEARIEIEAIRLGLYGKVADWITEPKEK